jgi:hypothetical protein
MFDSVFWSILLYSALVCIIATILCTLAPLAAWQTFFAWFSLAMPDGLYEFRLSLILDMKKIPDHMVFWICLKYALRFFVLYGREIVLSVTVIYFFPLMKSKYSSATEDIDNLFNSVIITLPLRSKQLIYQTYLLLDASIRFLPNWIIDASESVTHSLSSSDSEPPELELDPRAALALAKQQASKIERSDGYGDAAICQSISSYGKDESVDDISPRQNRSYLLLSDDPDCYVFDSVVGVIPRETRDLWDKSIRLAKLKSVGAVTCVGSGVVDLVSGSNEGDENNDKGKPYLSVNSNSVPLKRNLPPVRFSKP